MAQMCLLPFFLEVLKMNDSYCYSFDTTLDLFFFASLPAL